MTVRYIGITPDKICIVKNTIDEIIATPHIEYIFKEMKNDTSDGKRWPDYVAINTDGSNRVLSRKNFEIIDISDVSTSSFYGRNVRVFDTLIRKTFLFTTHKWGYDFIIHELLLLLEKIEEYGGCQKYQEKLKYDALDRENADLKKKILELQQEIELLKSKEN